MTAPGEWVLAIDFGTTNTVAAVNDAQGVRTLSVDGRSVIPSAVFLHPDGKNWSTGETALRIARRQLQWFEPNPKRCVPDGTMFLGGKNIAVGEAIKAVLRPILHEAAAQHGGRHPSAFIVTHPANWGDSRVAVLVDAAAAAAAATGRNWPKPQPLSEPVAAAQAVLGMADVPERARLVVLDLGGGTVDATAVDRDGDTLTVVGHPQGRDGLGGEDYDQRLARWMVAEVGAPELYDRLASSEDPDERERAIEIRTDARKVKEDLSFQPVVPAQLPKSPPELPDYTPVLVSRPQLEALISGGPGHEPGLAESVEVAGSVLSELPPGPPFVGAFLTGGCSRIPMLGALIQESTGRRPLTYGDPTTSVAQGAADFAWKALQQPEGAKKSQREEGTAPTAPLDGEETAASPPPPRTPSPPPGTAPPPSVPPSSGGRVGRRVAVLGASLLAVIGVVTGVAMAANHHPQPPPPPPPVPGPTTSVPIPEPTTPVPTATEFSNLTSDEQSLISSLDPNIFSSCTAAPDQEGGGVIAAVNCEAIDSGPGPQPLVVQFSGATAEQDWFNNNSGGAVNNDDCVDGEEVDTWSYNSVEAGMLGCAWLSDTDFQMSWTIDSSEIGVIADSTNSQALYDWWQNDGCVTQTSC